jgi:hypothetical protein
MAPRPSSSWIGSNQSDPPGSSESLQLQREPAWLQGESLLLQGEPTSLYGESLGLQVSLEGSKWVSMAPGSCYISEILPHPCKCGGDLYVL